MERIEVRTTTAGADDLALVSADLFEDSESESTRKSKLRGDLFTGRVLYVGFIETDERWRKTGAARRLLLHVIEVLDVLDVRAGTVDERADAFFAEVAKAVPEVQFNID